MRARTDLAQLFTRDRGRETRVPPLLREKRLRLRALFLLSTTKYSAEEGRGKPENWCDVMHDGRGEPQGEGCDGRNEPLDGLNYEPLDGLNYEPLEGLNYEPLEELFKSHGRPVTGGFTVQRPSLSKSVAC